MYFGKGITGSEIRDLVFFFSEVLFSRSLLFGVGYSQAQSHLCVYATLCAGCTCLCSAAVRRDVCVCVAFYSIAADFF